MMALRIFTVIFFFLILSNGQAQGDWETFEKEYLLEEIKTGEDHELTTYAKYRPFIRTIYSNPEIKYLIDKSLDVATGEHQDEILAQKLWDITTNVRNMLDNIEEKLLNKSTGRISPYILENQEPHFTDIAESCRRGASYQKLHKIIENYYEVNKEALISSIFTDYKIPDSERSVLISEVTKNSFIIEFYVEHEGCKLGAPVRVKIYQEGPSWQYAILHYPIKLQAKDILRYYREVTNIKFENDMLVLTFKKHFSDLRNNKWIEEGLSRATPSSDKKQWHMKGFFMGKGHDGNYESLNVVQATDNEGNGILISADYRLEVGEPMGDGEEMELYLPIKNLDCAPKNCAIWVKEPEPAYFAGSNADLSFRWNAQVHPKAKLFLQVEGEKSTSPIKTFGATNCNVTTDHTITIPESAAPYTTYEYWVELENAKCPSSGKPRKFKIIPNCDKIPLKWVKKPKAEYTQGETIDISFDYNRFTGATLFFEPYDGHKKIFRRQAKCLIKEPQKFEFRIPKGNTVRGTYQLTIKTSMGKELSKSIKINQYCVDSLKWVYEDGLKDTYLRGETINFNFVHNKNQPITITAGKFTKEIPVIDKDDCSTRVQQLRLPFGKGQQSITVQSTKESITHSFRVKNTTTREKGTRIRRFKNTTLGALVTSGVAGLVYFLIPQRSINY